MNRHLNRHELAGKTVHVKTRLPLYSQNNDPDTAVPLWIEDWWDRVAGRSWMDGVGNPACLHYAARNGFAGLPLDDQVVYGHAGGFGHLVHTSEIHEVVS